MAYIFVPHLDYPQLATSAQGNQLIANLEATRNKVVNYGSGSDVHVLPVSYTFPNTATTWLPSTGFVLNLRPTNYPDHTQFLIGFNGYVTYNAPGSAARRGALGLFINGTSGVTTAIPTDFQSLDAQQNPVDQLAPVNLIRVVTHDPLAPAGYLYFFLGAYLRDGAMNLRVSGDMWYKEL